MCPEITLRDETESDFAAIRDVTEAAFRTLAISGHTEQFIIEALRTAGALTISLVATLNGTVVGHLAFSPVTMSDGTPGWYGLGPVSVLPAYQRQGADRGRPGAAQGIGGQRLLPRRPPRLLRSIRI